MAASDTTQVVAQFNGTGGQSTFLSLAPMTSASYPPTPLTKSPVQTPNAETPNMLEGLGARMLKERRSSSMGSDSSSRRRFLKLGPVHFGEGDGKGDWSEDVIAE